MSVLKFAFLITAFALVSCGDAGSDRSKPGGAEQSEVKKTVPLGEAANFEAFEVKLVRVEQLSKVGNAYMSHKAPEGGTLVAVTYTLKNTGKEPLSFMKRPTLKLINPSGTVFSEDSEATIYFGTEKDFNNKAISDLNPGIKTTGGIVWEVSKKDFDISTWKVVLDGHENDQLSLK